jgi:hypothetical protein
MSIGSYISIHKALHPRRKLPAGEYPEPPLPLLWEGRRSGIPNPPRTGYNGIYFLYEKGEVFEHEGETFERIVRIGINEAPGRFADRVRDYGRNGGSPLHGYIREALAEQRSVDQGDLSDWQVTGFIRRNFFYRKILLPSASDAQNWEKKIIPVIARHSPEFASKYWLGQWARFTSGMWNVHYVGWPCEFDNKDLQQFLELERPKSGEPGARATSPAATMLVQ